MTLAILNELRIRNGKTELKSWKESKAKLAERIEAEKEIAEAQAEDDRATARDEQAALDALNDKLGKIADKARADAKRVPNPKIGMKHGEVATPKAIKAVRVAANKINVAEIAKELGINAKVARAKLRKLNVNRADAAAIRKALTK